MRRVGLMLALDFTLAPLAAEAQEPGKFGCIGLLGSPSAPFVGAFKHARWSRRRRWPRSAFGPRTKSR